MTESPPPTDWHELVPGDEHERFERHAAFIAEVQRANRSNGTAHRSLHNKPLLGARAEFTVRADIPDYARVGLFAAPGSYAAWVRYSNGSARRARDGAGDVRGFAVKIVGAPGKKLIPGLEAAETQDFLSIQTPVFGFRDADEFMALVRAGSGSPLLLVPRLVSALGLGRTFALLGGLRKHVLAPVATLSGLRFWSPVPIKWGPYAVHFSFKPVAPPTPPTSLGHGPDHLTEDLIARLRAAPLRYDFMIQFYRDPRRTPIEDGSVEWLESDSPFIPVATLTIPQQDLASEAGQRDRARVEGFSFDPWHASEDFRPLGNIMRARSPAYRVSTEGRHATSELDHAALRP